MEKSLFFVLLSFAILMTYSRVAVAAPGDVDVSLTCSKKVIDTVYIPKLREVVDWPDDQIRPYAIQMCQLEKQRGQLQLSIKNRADQMRAQNWRICKEVIPGNPNPTDAECKAAHAQLINDLIDHCIAVVNIGHNPHNVELYIDPLKVEVSCLKGVDTALK